MLNEVETDLEPAWSETLRPGGRGHSTDRHSGRGNLCKKPAGEKSTVHSRNVSFSLWLEGAGGQRKGWRESWAGHTLGLQRWLRR